MGCNASRLSANSITPCIEITTLPAKPRINSADDFEPKTSPSIALTHVVLPSIPTAPSKKVKPITSFEIPIDDVFFKPIARKVLQRSSLPKLDVSKVNMSDIDARWDSIQHTKRPKPKLRSNAPKPLQDQTTILGKLAIKEARSNASKERKEARLAAKLAAQEAHAQTVLDRKRALELCANNLSHASFGGEVDGLVLTNAAKDRDAFERDSGKGSSYASIAIGGSRSASGKSNYVSEINPGHRVVY